MKETSTFSQKLKQFVLLFFPIFITQMSLFAMSFLIQQCQDMQALLI